MADFLIVPSEARLAAFREAERDVLAARLHIAVEVTEAKLASLEARGLIPDELARYQVVADVEPEEYGERLREFYFGPEQLRLVNE